MKLLKPIEESGFFWLPEEPERQLPGVLRISESGEATLEITSLSHRVASVLGKHRFGDPWFGEQNRKFKRVVGIIKRGYVTLEDCFYRSLYNEFRRGLTISTIDPCFVFSGFSYGDEDEITFSELEFSVEGLDEWLGISGIHIDPNLGTDRWQNVSVHYDLPEEVALHLPDEMEMKFSFQASVPFGVNTTEARISQKAYILLKSMKLRPLDDFLSLMSKLHRFFCFAVDKTISLNHVTAYSSKITRGKKNREVPIEIYFRSTLYSDKNPEIHLHDMLFRYQDVTDKLERILTGWLQKYHVYEQVFNEYFAVKYGAYKYLEGDFLSLVRGIEVLHRKYSQDTEMSEEEFRDMVSAILKNIPNDKQEWIERKLKYANELSLRKRMKEMLKPFQHLYGDKTKRIFFINKVVNTRNYLTHFDDSLTKDVAKEEELLALCTKLEALFQLRFLEMIGMDSAFIDNVVNENRSLRRTLEFVENDNS